MRWRVLKWIVASLLLLAGAALFWQVGNRQVARESAAAPARARVLDTTPRSLRHSEAFRLLTKSVESAKSNSLATLRLRNANFTGDEWIKRPTAVLLENALIDTAAAPPVIPAHLRAHGDPGTYIVQARGRIDESFRAALRQVGARIVSYIPNNAYLVRATGEAAQALAGQGRVQSVLSYEPYYKLKTELLRLALGNADLPLDESLNVALFADAHDATIAALKGLGAAILAEEPSPFGPVVTVRPQPDTLVALAGLPGVQVIEVAGERVPANDRGRARLEVATNTTAPDNWLGLTGNNVLVNVNDSGVDATHPDLAGRMTAQDAATLVDVNGHGTHVIGTIAGNGAMSVTVTSTNVPGSETPVTNGQFRGEAPAARVFVQPVGFVNRPGISAGAPWLSDSDLQTTAAQTNAFISNNSWHYGGNNGYDLAAARYDAATRDALPGRPGSQPLLFVFAAGNAGGGDDNGLGGDADSIRSPGTAKNVITVGAIEQNRDITNEVVTCRTTDTGTNTMVICLTNTPFETQTDTDDQVAAFSGRGNNGFGVEGESGRFKPDVVAPGAWVISTRSAQWDEAEYSNPTNYYSDAFPDNIVQAGFLNNYAALLPPNAVRFWIDLYPNATSPTPFPDLPLYVKQSSYPTTNSYDFIRTNHVAMPPDGGPGLSPVDATWNYSVGNPYTNAVSYGLVTTIATTNDNGNEYEVRSNLNATLGLYYRYESGSSMAAAHVSGTLALMQEFFERRLGRTNSPALMKALLINGARWLGEPYDFEVRTAQNYEGWGLPKLPATLPTSLTNLNTQTSGPMFLFDQDPARALATGETHVRNIHLTDLARTYPLRITLVWTDPPGNPAAGVKLVNDLDLVVTNLDTGEVYVGNDIQAGVAGGIFNQATPSNSTPNVDVVNNVENVYLPAVLGTNYAIGVIGSRVNVNAITADPDNTAQDYALVISSGDGETADAITLTEQPTVSVNVPLIAESTNMFNPTTTPGYSGTLLLGQHVGANTPLMGVTNGMTNQWHFYVLTNTESYTNAAFLTFLPNTLSIPRLGVNEDKLGNATREEADIDLYVSTDPRLLELAPDVIAQCAANSGPNFSSSRTRGGTEVIATSNAVPGGVYFIGVKAEDQMASEYGFLGVFSLLPFSEENNGNPVLRGFPAPVVIPDGANNAPGAGFMFAIGITPISVRRVVVTDQVTHEKFGDLIGSLSHNGRFAVLNNHTPPPVDPIPLTYTWIYEDNGEGDIIGSQGTDGPESLRNFVGEQGLGLWLLQMVDDAQTQTGRLESLSILLEPQNLDETSAPRTVQPFSWTYDFIEVSAAASNLTVCVWSNTLPMELYIRRGEFPTREEYDKFMTVPVGGGCLSINRADLPPLTAGRYYIGVYNPNATAQTIRLTAKLDYDLAAIVPVSFTSGALPLQDDAVTYATQLVTNRARISSVEVGLRIDHPRISDLAFTLVSPKGTRILLMEDRGWTNSANIGSSLFQTNTTAIVDGFETISPGTYTTNSVMGDWTVTNNAVTVISNTALAHTGQNVLALRDGTIQRNYATQPGAYYTLLYAYRLDGIVSWWPAETNTTDVADGNHGTLVNDTTYGTGMVGGSFVLDGVYDAVSVGTNSNLQLQDFSIEGWVKRSDALRTSRNSTGDGTIFSVGAQGTGFAFYLKDTSATTNIGQLALGNSPGSLVKSVSRVADTNWHHVAVTKLGTRVVFYIDGIADPPLIYNSGGFTFNAPAHIGAWWNPVSVLNPDHSFWGAIDELTVYNRELAAAEVLSIYTNGAAGKCGQPVQQTSCLSQGAQVTVAGHVTNTVVSSSSTWATNVITFTGTQTNTLVEFAALGRDSGLLLDTIALVEDVVVGQNFYLTFTEATNLTATPIKFAAPPFEPATTPVTNFINGFEGAARGDYTGPTNFDGWTAMTTNPVTVINDGAVAHTGAQYLALRAGEIQRPISATSGRNCVLEFVSQSGTNLGAALASIPGLVTNVIMGTTNWVTNSIPFTAPPAGITVDFVGTNGGFSQSVSAQLANGSFELGLVGWIVNTPSIVISPFVPASDGANCVEIGSDNLPGAILSQTFPAIGGLQHVLTFDILALGDPGRTGVVQVVVDSASGILASQMFTNAARNTLPFTYETQSIPFSVPQGITSLTLSFIDLSPGDGVAVDPVIDNVRLTEVPSGVLLDTFTLTEFPGQLYYLPEESLKALQDEGTFGTWTLEILDTRVGATNPEPRLLNWQLNFVFQNENPIPGILRHGEPQTNTVPAGMIAYYVVNVPAWAQFATNTLLTATAPLNIWFNQGTPPSGTNAGDFLLIGAATSGSATLSAASVPPLRSGEPYYLGVQNTNAVDVNFALQVDFDITPLLNGVPVTSILDPVASLLRYFYYDVSSNATAVSFKLYNLSGNVDLVARRGAPLPTLTSFDYGSFNPGALDDEILVFTSSRPVALSPGRWYLGVFNQDAVPVTNTIVATEFTNSFPNIIDLTNGVPYFNTNAGPIDALDYYHYRVTAAAVRVQFEVNGPSGDVTLVARKGLPLPDLTTFDYASANPGTNDELILLFTNSFPVPLSGGAWYLAVANRAGGPVSYAIKATEWPAGSVPPPPAITNVSVISNSFCVTWTSQPGVQYHVDGLTNLSSTNWVTVSPTITATDYSTTWCLALPSPFHFFRVVEGPAATPVVPPPVITNTGVFSNHFCLTWTSSAGVQYHVDGLTNLNSTNWVTASPTITATDFSTTWCLALPSPFQFFRVVEGPAATPVVPPPVITNTGVFSNHFCLTWTSLAGVQYHVDGLTNLNSTNWVTASPTITATDFSTTWCLALPSPFQFFRVLQGPAPTPAAPPVFTGFTRQTNGILIQWTGATTLQYQLDWTPTLSPPAWTNFSNVFTSPTGLFSFLDDGTQTAGLGAQRFYRVLQLP